MKLTKALRAFDRAGSTLLGQVAQLRTLALRLRGRDARQVVAESDDIEEARRRLAAASEVRALVDAYLRDSTAALNELDAALKAKD